MSSESVFYYPVVMRQDSASSNDAAPAVSALPQSSSVNHLVALLALSIGDQEQGLYVFDGLTWRFAMPMKDVSAAIVRGDVITTYINKVNDVTAPTGSTVYKNGYVQPGLGITHGPAVYAVRTPPSSSGGGAVTSVNSQTGDVVVDASNLPGLAVVAQTGNYADLIGKPAAYVLPAATATVLGGVIVPSSSNLVVDGSGNIDIKASLLATINGKVNSVAASGAGQSLVSSTTSGNVVLKDLVAGTGVTLTPSSTGITITSASAYTLPAATSTTLGGVIVPSASNLSVDGSGNIDIKAGFVTVVNNKIGSLADTSGAGSSIISSGSGPTAQLKTIEAGSNVSVVDNTDRLTIGVTLPTATSSVLGVVKIGSGLNVDGAGLLTAPAASTTLTGDVTGTGTGTVATTLANSGVTVGTYTKVTVDGKGRVTVGSNIASSDVTTALGFTPYNATNPNSYISGNQNITVTGDATGSGTTGIALTLANSGVTVGTYTKVTVDAKGRVTVGSNPTTLAGYGITDAISSSGGAVMGTLTFSAGATVTGLPTPVANSDGANKIYVDNQIAAVVNGTSWRPNAKAATTGDITLSGTQTIDGYSVVASDRVLVKDQTDPTQNGVYVAAAGAWTRATDTDTGAEIQGMAILVLNGTVNAFTQWVNTNTSTPTVGTDPITYTQLQGAGQAYTAGAGLTLTGSAFSITPTGVSNGTYTKVTVNTLGQVTAGTNLSSSDVTTALTFTPYNATNPSGYISGNQTITLSGDATGSGSTGITVTLASTGVGASTYRSVTVDAKGRVTAGTNPTTLAGYGITDALALSGGSVSGNITMTSGATVTGIPTPSAGSDAANKTYTDAGDTAVQNAVPWKTQVAAATTADITLSGTQTIDGYAAIAGDRVLVKAQATQTNNGIYVVAAGAWSRATDSDTALKIQWQSVLVRNGTANANTLWMNTNTTVTLGSTNITYSQVGGTAYTAGTGLTLSGSQFSITNVGTAGTYTKVTTNAQGQVTSGTQLASSDVTTALTFTPVNKAGDTLSGALNYAATVSMAAAATTNIGAAASNVITVTGNTAITAFDTIAAGAVRELRFTGAPTLTYNASSLILPSAANIVVVSGDTAQFVSLGSGNWFCSSYTRASGQPLVGSPDATKLPLTGGTLSGALNFAPTATVVAAATTNIGAAAANDISISGGTTITAFDTIAAGAVRTLVFGSPLTLTHNATSLILPNGGANITTASGDIAQFTSLGSGNWKCDYYQRLSGQALIGTPDATKLPLTGGTLSGALNQAPTVTLASASTVNIGAAASNDISITGTTTITAFDTIASGAVRKVAFTGVLTLTYNATSLILPTQANITTGAGDVAQFTSLGSGNWRCDFYTKAGGAFATLSGVETLTNKTLTTPTLTNPTITGFIESGVSPAAGSAFTVNLANGTDIEYSINANATITLPSPTAGQSFSVAVSYTGAFTVAWAGATIKWANGNTQPGSTSTNGKVDIYIFKSNRAGTAWYGSDGGRNF